MKSFTTSPLRILVTGARAPATVDLVRWLSSLGHTVDAADTLCFSPARASRHCVRYLRYPSPRQETEAFHAWARQHAPHYDLLWPTCEEVFELARSGAAGVLAPPYDLLRMVHDKGAFAAWLAASRLGLTAPSTTETTVLAGNTLDVPAGYVAKPAFSRFGHRTVFGPARTPIEKGERRWLLQERVTGREVCSYTLAENGSIQAQCIYEDPERREGEPCLVFRRAPIPELEAFCRTFCAALQWQGQIAFDFRQDSGGTWRVLEANPRLTSGIHLVRRPEAAEVQLRSAVAVRRPHDLVSRRFWQRPEVLGERGDRAPEGLALLCLAELQLRFGWPVAEAATKDIAHP